MPPRRKLFALTLTLLLAGLPAAPALAADVFRVSAIPDESPTELQRKFKPLGEHLERKLGMKVEFVPVTDYAASVEALVNKKVDMVWFGGFTFVQARIRSKDGVEPLVQRAEDEKFRSVFITPADSGVSKLEDLKGKSVAFGSPSSTSGHLMPRSFLLAAKIDPDRDLRVSFSGAHDATALAVAGGRVAAGALNISVWEKMVAEKRVDPEKVRVFYTTPPYYDYNWTVRKDIDPALRAKLLDAFLSLDPAVPADKQILDLQRASRFVPTKAANYASIEEAARSAGLLK
ncbi:putative selenate ABC transporter substrate-binding protein [Burkholderiaceae bacterium FT117]|uniref:putative selenate ABC transporter substrate-binding protein n=1 Tax=Zeimonas sediminis TaxID=2944268 RepID=UPI002342E628|nr:putative selenate ABC transporter substrate-binding protein [Zeimonas sediminis]MCM5569628.1 putative selenate ABC transporter substrate-binding protein [Zeimonas sediminis]